MPDMLVKLYELPPVYPVIQSMESEGITIRRVIPTEKHVVTDWILAHFNEPWKSETEIAFSNRPPTCFIAVENERMIGFGCYDATAKGFFGPTGVDPIVRGKGIGKAILLACLHDMRSQGYGYAIIGAAGPTDFYTKTVGATIIEGSIPGIYKGMLKREKQNPL